MNMGQTNIRPSLAGVRTVWSKSIGILRSAPKLPTLLLFVIAVAAIFGPLMTPHSSTRINLRDNEKPPAFQDGGDMTYILGTDRQGRDILTRVLRGARVSLSVAGLSILVGGIAGSVLGLVAGYSGGWVDALVMRTVDVWLAIPAILVGLIFAITVGPSYWMVVTILGLVLWARYARLVRGEVLAFKNRDFVDLARVAGCSSTRIILVHILPNLLSSLVVLSTLQVGWAIISEGSLSFLGVGIPPPTPSWGGMVAQGRNFVDTSWWISVFPGIAIMVTVLGFNLFGDWLRDTLDPKLRQL